MIQLVQSLKTGEFSFVQSPMPRRTAGFVLVRNHASLISAGTERSTVKAAKASLLGKARQRPDKVRQVLGNLKKEGLVATVRRVRDKLDEPATLGYATSGVVLEADADVAGLVPGQRVACGGANYACHAEIVLVPRNLVVPVPTGVSDEEACFATLGAIALQGVRRARVGLGDRVLVIGLGLLGQLTWQLLSHAGCIPIGTDISPAMVDLARASGLDMALVRGDQDVEGYCVDATDGNGVDAVIITAATSSTDPIELAGSVCRERGVVSVVGAVPMNMPREPYYRKELDVVVSRSYGPGRYDPSYEEGGQDYPYGYVRWTEGRNMAAFLGAVNAKGVNVKPLITHRFRFEEAVSAYEIVSGVRDEFHVGIVLSYDGKPQEDRVVRLKEGIRRVEGKIGLGLIGAGAFARGSLLPHLTKRSDIALEGVVTARGFTAAEAGRRYGFSLAASDPEEVFSNKDVHAVVIATRHDSHADLVERALSCGKHVFVEKPLCLTPRQLGRLADVSAESRTALQVGFNRRFSPLAVALRAKLASTKARPHVTYRVNAGALPGEHWLIDPKIGGGRIIGEGCHFIDLISFLCGAEPSRVSAIRNGRDEDGVTSIQLEMGDGSTGVVVYQANAPRGIPKERIEAFAGGRGGVIHDWKKVELWTDGKRKVVKVSGQAKGISEEIEAYVESIRTGQPAIPLRSLLMTTAASFAAMRSLETGGVESVEIPSREGNEGGAVSGK